jgi:hypothetical protein
MWKPIASIFIFLILGLFDGICGATIIDKIIAVVNGEIITLSELERFGSELSELAKASASRIEKGTSRSPYRGKAR